MKIDFSAYKASLKSLDTEETIDLAFYRPIGYCWALLAKRLGVSPNAITIASIFIGIAAGIAFYFNQLWINVIGMALLVWANSFDSADGQLARMTGQYSRIGRILDGLSGDLWFFTIYVAICLRENYTSQFFMAHPWLIWIIAVVSGVCHAKQAAMADYYRQLHLYFLKGEGGAELDSTEALRKKLKSLSWTRDFWKKITLWFYANYTANQEVMTPAMQEMRRELALRFPDGRIPEAFRADFRKLSLPLMKFTNILSFNWRTIALFCSLFARMPWLYFAFELVVLNSLLVYMMRRHEAICRKMTAALRAGDFAPRSLD
ncbi:MAG: CDP-alcohol phosphatidyltransferase family protein [Muribaculaceae bacterium]|nr:CDP-alcohol phosphatidyltransferase family protein [Muribaculaceae bacterium]